MTTTPAPVDVLRLFDAYIEFGIPQERPELQAARAAVVGLVAAADNAERVLGKTIAAGQIPDGYLPVLDDLRAALARVGAP